jgi:hypothetical protein
MNVISIKILTLDNFLCFHQHCCLLLVNFVKHLFDVYNICMIEGFISEEWYALLAIVIHRAYRRRVGTTAPPLA